MSARSAIPRFGAPYCTPAYYQTVDGILAVLRPCSTLRTIAAHLTAQNLRTPSGLSWDRRRVASYIRNRKLDTNTTN